MDSSLSPETAHSLTHGKCSLVFEEMGACDQTRQTERHLQDQWRGRGPTFFKRLPFAREHLGPSLRMGSSRNGHTDKGSSTGGWLEMVRYQASYHCGCLRESSVHGELWEMVAH